MTVSTKLGNLLWSGCGELESLATPFSLQSAVFGNCSHVQIKPSRLYAGMAKDPFHSSQNMQSLAEYLALFTLLSFLIDQLIGG